MYIIKINEKGIGLVEVIAALGISVVVITSLVSLSLFTLRASLESKLMLEGTKVANRELELVRAYRDGADLWVDTTTFPAAGAGGLRAFLNDIDSCTSTAVCSINSANFTISNALGFSGSGAERMEWWFYVTKTDGTNITSSDSSIDEVRVTVEAHWLVGGEHKYARLYTDLTSWISK